jgi:hypothetical protein
METEAGFRVPPRRPLLALAALGGSALACAGIIAGLAWIAWAQSWTRQATPSDPEWGITFSCRYAEYLLLEDPALGGGGYVDRHRPERAAFCATTLGELLDRTGARLVRLSVEWSDVEPVEGAFDWAPLDAQLEAAARREVRVLMSIGMKSQRHPEYYLPDWVMAGVDVPHRGDPAGNPRVRAAALRMIGEAVRHFAASPVIDEWMVENEPFQGSARVEFWELGRDYVREAMAVFRANDARGRPLVLNHSGHWSWDQKWRWALEGDIVAVNIYPWRRWDLLGVGPKRTTASLELGPVSPNWAARGREATAAGKPFWITEMQAEPWGDPDIRVVSPANPAPDMSIAKFERNIGYARRTGASRVYLWGSEWWLFQALRFGDTRWIETARGVLAGGGGLTAPSPSEAGQPVPPGAAGSRGAP